jgi:hypothetical protein
MLQLTFCQIGETSALVELDLSRALKIQSMTHYGIR